MFGHSLTQFSDNSQTNMLMPVGKCYYIISHLLIRMSLLHRSHDFLFQEKRKYHFYLYFLFMMLFAFFSYIRISSFTCFKCSCPLCIKTAFAVLSYMSATCLKNCISNLLCFI